MTPLNWGYILLYNHFESTSATSAKRLDKENLFFCDLSEGTRYVLNAPGKDWNLDLSMPRVRICKKRKEDEHKLPPKFKSKDNIQVNKTSTCCNTTTII